MRTDSEYIQHLYGTVLEIQKKVTFNQARGIFGFGESDNIGKVAFPAVQAAPAFSRAFPSLFGGDCSVRCLIPQVRIKALCRRPREGPARSGSV